MSGYNRARTEIEALFADEMRKLAPGVFVKPENVASENQPSGATWCALSVRPATSGARGVGNDGVRDVGLVFVQVFTPLSVGTKPSDDLVDVVLKIFERARTLTTWFRAASIAVIGEAEGWYQVNVSIEYISDTEAT